MAKKQKSTIIYDGTCNFCQKQVQRIKKKDTKNQFTFASSSLKNLEKTCGVSKEDAMKGIIFIDEKNQIFHKAAAIQQIYLRLSKTHILSWGREIPLLKHLIDWGYKLLARNRYRLYGRCTENCKLK